jgi:hypothetical protein
MYTMGDARAYYRGLRRRVLRTADDDRAYVRRLWAIHDADLSGYPADLVLPDWLRSIETTISDPELNTTALIEWVDAFPAAVLSEVRM